METLEKLVSQANDSQSTTWKWVLGIVIALIIVFIEWKLKNQSTKIAVFEAERAVLKEKAADLKVKLDNERDMARIEEYKNTTSELRALIAYRAIKSLRFKKEIEEKKERVKKAKQWKELEDLANGR
jgi:uncharacterized membrane protein YgaE (UPF0421/DUF939 family)